MLGAVIRNGNNTLVAELPTGTMDLQTKLSSIGIDVPADRIRISDEDGDQIRVKLYASSPEEAHDLPAVSHPGQRQSRPITVGFEEKEMEYKPEIRQKKPHISAG